MASRHKGKRKIVIGGMIKGFNGKLQSALAKNLGRVKNIWKK